MKQRFVYIGVPLVVVVGVAAVAAVYGATATALVGGLTGFQEVPAISTTGVGVFSATVDATQTSISYTLGYQNLTGNPTMAHLHIAQRGVNGSIVAFLCGGGGKPACPASGAVSGTIVAADIMAVPSQGIAAGELAEVIRAANAGAIYANVHSSTFGGGEIRGQLRMQ